MRPPPRTPWPLLEHRRQPMAHDEIDDARQIVPAQRPNSTIRPPGCAASIAANPSSSSAEPLRRTDCTVDAELRRGLLDVSQTRSPWI